MNVSVLAGSMPMYSTILCQGRVDGFTVGQRLKCGAVHFVIQLEPKGRFECRHGISTPDSRMNTFLAENVLSRHDPLVQLVHLHGDACRMAYRAPLRASQPPGLSCQRAVASAYHAIAHRR